MRDLAYREVKAHFLLVFNILKPSGNFTHHQV
jgi:hypothetical protein